MDKKKILLVFSDIKSEQNYLISYLKDLPKQYEIFISFQKINYKFDKNYFYQSDFNFLKKINSRVINTNLINEILFCFDIKKIIKILIFFFFKKNIDIYTNYKELKKNISKKKIIFQYIFINESNIGQEFLDNFTEFFIYAFPHSLVLRGYHLEKKRRIKLKDFMNKANIDISKNKIDFVINFKEELNILRYKYGSLVNIISSKCSLINEKYLKKIKKNNNNILILIGKDTYHSELDTKNINSILVSLVNQGYNIILKNHPRTSRRLINKNKNIFEFNGSINDICHEIDFAIVTSKTNSVIELVSRGIFVIEYYNSKRSTYNNKKYEFLQNGQYVSLSNYYGFVKNFSEKDLLLNFLNKKDFVKTIYKEKDKQINNLKKYLNKNYSTNKFRIRS